MKAAFIFPSAATSYAKIVKGERNDKAEKPCFYSFGTAEPHPILCKDVANERKESLLLFPECSYILCKCTKKNLQSNKIRLNFIPNRLFDFIYISCRCQTYWLPVLSEI